jgi:hypothetical protein
MNFIMINKGAVMRGLKVVVLIIISRWLKI